MLSHQLLPKSYHQLFHHPLSTHSCLQARDNIDNPYKVPTIEDLLSDIGENEPVLKSNSPISERTENANFLEEEAEIETNVDEMFDSLLESDD